MRREPGWHTHELTTTTDHEPAKLFDMYMPVRTELRLLPTLPSPIISCYPYFLCYVSYRRSHPQSSVVTRTSLSSLPIIVEKRAERSAQRINAVR
jgi:hypothetical protein